MCYYTVTKSFKFLLFAAAGRVGGRLREIRYGSGQQP